MSESCSPSKPAAEPHAGRPKLPSAAELRQLPPDGGPHYNRLVFEKSPYLLQHAANPVDWYPWGPAAFEKARRENKPIFLSIGYSTCHWCHVMEHESFENPAIADLLNRDFVAVKVDREERPDVDAVYMLFVQATTGSGGWPMSVWLTPDLKPFTGGTYFPPDDRHGRPGFPSVLAQIAKAWSENRERIVASSEQVLTRLREFATNGTASASVQLERNLLELTYHQIASTYEPEFGGFGDAPKFPRPAAPNFMLRYGARTGSTEALTMTAFTLRKMAEGGMYDQLGGGFHRYSVDRQWQVPHFEKMLYDQAQLVCTYLDAYQITRDPFFADIARGVLDYVRRDMTGPHGEFFSAEDADSPVPADPARQAEGAFYVWEHAEIEAVLGAHAALFDYHYGVQPKGNVGNDPHGEFPNKNIVMVAHTLAETAAAFNLTPEAAASRLADARHLLFVARAKRPRPLLDDKAITAWNGLMISAFARASQVLDAPEYLAAAVRAAAFARARLVAPASGQLYRRYRDGDVGGTAGAEDYAFLIQGLLDLYAAAFNVADLEWAVALQDRFDARYWDDGQGGYFRTAGDDPTVLLRMKEDYDGAEPTANSIALMNLLRLAHITGSEAYRARAEKTLAAFSQRLHEMPSAMPQMMVAFDFHLAPVRQIVIAGAPDATDTRALLRVVHARFRPHTILLLADGGRGQQLLASYHDFFRDLTRQDGHATAYVCENFTCQLPTTDPAKLAELLGDAR